jgi:isocitrate/isopropylmalate dehydrogenase
MAQAQHGSAPDIAGTDRANPVSLLLSAVMLLGWNGERATRTTDLGGALGTREVGTALAKILR